VWRRVTYNTSQLLESLKTATSCETLAKVTLEAVEVGSLAERQFVLVIRGDLSELFDKSRVLKVKLAELGERLRSLLRVALLNVPLHTVRLAISRLTKYLRGVSLG
jgi:hypothetical protein